MHEVFSSYFLGKIRKISSVCHMLNLPVAPFMLKLLFFFLLFRRVFLYYFCEYSCDILLVNNDEFEVDNKIIDYSDSHCLTLLVPIYTLITLMIHIYLRNARDYWPMSTLYKYK